MWVTQKEQKSLVISRENKDVSKLENAHTLSE